MGKDDDFGGPAVKTVDTTKGGPGFGPHISWIWDKNNVNLFWCECLAGALQPNFVDEYRELPCLRLGNWFCLALIIIILDIFSYSRNDTCRVEQHRFLLE